MWLRASCAWTRSKARENRATRDGCSTPQGIFARSGVERRSLQLSDDLLELSLQGRTAQVEHELLSRSIDAIDALELDLGEIGTIVSASLYSLGVPTLAHRLVDHYAMDPTTDKYHVTGVGCASGVPLMKLAAQALPGHPGKHALVVAAESMSASGLATSKPVKRISRRGVPSIRTLCSWAVIWRP